MSNKKPSSKVEDWKKHDIYDTATSSNRILTRSQTAFARSKNSNSDLELFADSSKHQPSNQPHLLAAMKGQYGAIPRTIVTRSSAKFIEVDEELVKKLDEYKKYEPTKEAAIVEQKEYPMKETSKVEKKEEPAKQEKGEVKEERKEAPAKEEKAEVKEVTKEGAVKEEKTEVKEEKSTLKEEKAEVKEEKAELKEEKAELKEEKSALKEEKAEVKEEKAELKEEKAELKEEKAE